MGQEINPDTHLRPSGFSYAIASTGNRTVHFAGHTALDPHGDIVGASDIVAQYEQALKNLEVTALAADVAPRDLAMMTIYVTDVEAYKSSSKEIGAIYRRHFGSYYPAMTLVQIERLWDERAMIEIEAVAVL
jgi:enamine deaminase RidA (YjgF/YER057c/UK114 family)